MSDPNQDVYEAFGLTIDDRQKLAGIIVDKFKAKRVPFYEFFSVMKLPIRLRPAGDQEAIAQLVDATLAKISHIAPRLRDAYQPMSVVDFFKDPMITNDVGRRILNALRNDGIFEEMQQTPLSTLSDDLWARLRIKLNVGWKGLFPLIVIKTVFDLNKDLPRTDLCVATLEHSEHQENDAGKDYKEAARIMGEVAARLSRPEYRSELEALNRRYPPST